MLCCAHYLLISRILPELQRRSGLLWTWPVSPACPAQPAKWQPLPAVRTGSLDIHPENQRNTQRSRNIGTTSTRVSHKNKFHIFYYSASSVNGVFFLFFNWSNNVSFFKYLEGEIFVCTKINIWYCLFNPLKAYHLKMHFGLRNLPHHLCMAILWTCTDIIRRFII